MPDAQFLTTAGRGLAEIIHDIKPDQLDAPTPCADYDVRKLLNHLLFWGPSLEGAGRKEAVPPPAASDADVDLTVGDWAGALAAHLDRTIATWSAPTAWTGETSIFGPTKVPAPVIGRMVITELTVHSWDLAQATGQRPERDAALIDYVHAEVSATADQGRRMGAYGPEFTVPTTASTLDKLLGMTGRDPAWTSLWTG